MHEDRTSGWLRSRFVGRSSRPCQFVRAPIPRFHSIITVSGDADVCGIRERLRKTTPYGGSVRRGGMNLFRERVAAVSLAHEHAVLQINRDGRLLYVALSLDALDDLFARERPLALQYSFDDITHDSRLVAPLLECVETAADEDETGVLNELVVGRRGMRRA